MHRCGYVDDGWGFSVTVILLAPMLLYLIGGELYLMTTQSLYSYSSS